MFQIGDVVVYTIYGICKVDSITTLKLAGKEMNYYVLHPLNESKTELTIPVDNPLTIERLHPLLSKDEIENIITQIPFLDIYWIDNDNERKKIFSDIIKKGNRKETIKMIKSIKYHQLSLRNKSRKLHAVDEQAMKDAQKLIVDEFSYVLNENQNYIFLGIEEDLIKMLDGTN